MSSDLEGVREKIAQGWTQGHYGVDASGLPPLDEVGYACFCLFGAIHNSGLDVVSTALLLGFDDPGDLIQWNDKPDRTQADVLARIDAALAREVQPS